MSSYFCPVCGRYRDVVLTHKPILIDVKDDMISCFEIVAVCPRCETPVYIPKLNDINADLRELVAAINS